MPDARQPAEPVVNFGGNVRFQPQHHYTPTSEEEVLAILDRHVHEGMRSARQLSTVPSWCTLVLLPASILFSRGADHAHYGEVRQLRQSHEGEGRGRRQ